MSRVTVFGSFVVDLMARTPHLPVPGETVKGTMFRLGPGGKGFNQAVAAHKAGAEVTVVTKLGRDSFAAVAEDTMRELGMDASRVLYSEDAPTGCALISVDEKTGQNEIVIVPGALNTISPDEIRAAPAGSQSGRQRTRRRTCPGNGLQSHSQQRAVFARYRRFSFSVRHGHTERNRGGGAHRGPCGDG